MLYRILFLFQLGLSICCIDIPEKSGQSLELLSNEELDGWKHKFKKISELEHFLETLIVEESKQFQKTLHEFQEKMTMDFDTVITWESDSFQFYLQEMRMGFVDYDTVAPWIRETVETAVRRFRNFADERFETIKKDISCFPGRRDQDGCCGKFSPHYFTYAFGRTGTRCSGDQVKDEYIWHDINAS